jgi:ribosomal protein S18 acetylase RimI-like enzyme
MKEDAFFRNTPKGSLVPGLRLPIVCRKEVKPEDPENVRRIVLSSGFFSSTEVVVAVELVEERLAKGLESGYHFLFAEYDGVPVGYSCFGPIACTKGSYDLYWIAVRNDLRRLGIGRALLFLCLEFVTSLGARKLYVETSSRPQYAPTRSFYKSHGFAVEAVLKDFYEGGDDKIIYARTIE